VKFPPRERREKNKRATTQHHDNGARTTQIVRVPYQFKNQSHLFHLDHLLVLSSFPASRFLNEFTRLPSFLYTQKMSPKKAAKVYLYLCVFRVLNALLIQSQFDPDEYWQNLEPAYCKVFSPGKLCKGYTWEWMRRPSSIEFDSVASWFSQALEGPVRSYASVLPTYLFYKLLRDFHLDTTWLVSRGPVILHAFIVAAPTDLSVWLMARWMYMESPQDTKKEHLAWWCLFLSMSSWFNAYSLIRTYSNSVETVLLAVGMALVSPVRSCFARYLSSICFFLASNSPVTNVTLGAPR
jgi:hypothetical protein